MKTREIWVKRGKLSPFHFRFTTSGSGDVISGYATSDDVISGDVSSGDVTAPPQMLTELSPYTTNSFFLVFLKAVIF